MNSDISQHVAKILSLQSKYDVEKYVARLTLDEQHDLLAILLRNEGNENANNLAWEIVHLASFYLSQRHSQLGKLLTQES